MLMHTGQERYVGGQEDMITDVALQLVAERERGAVRVRRSPLGPARDRRTGHLAGLRPAPRLRWSEREFDTQSNDCHALDTPIL
ncbi:hypothetical protein [Streptomyces sp. NPDC088246]|uniref:hypothetical protein n=1 Tax=Streptomyces sp. NPDC088246 TaxID=3365842 RepID=UPI0037F471BC